MAPGPSKKSPMLYSTQRACEYLGISQDTLRRYAKILGIRGRKCYGVRGRYYLYPELIMILRLRAPRPEDYRARVLDRYEVMRRKGLDKVGEDDVFQ
jgi:hypothetical protein